MQRKAPLTPQARKPNRPMARSTMAPSDLSTTVIGGPVGRQAPMSRHSIMPSLQSTQESTAKKSEAASTDAEIKYLYNTYLQTEALKLMLKKKMGEKEKKNLTNLAALIKEEHEIKKELSSVEFRTKALENLSQLQNTVDEQLLKTKAQLTGLEKKPKNVLKQLESMLESLDVLKCKNISIPQTVDDMNKAHDQLMNCVSPLTSINTVIGTQGDVLITYNKELDDLKNTHNDLLEFSEKITENLEQLQISILKEGEKSLMLARSSRPKE